MAIFLQVSYDHFDLEFCVSWLCRTSVAAHDILCVPFRRGKVSGMSAVHADGGDHEYHVQGLEGAMIAAAVVSFVLTAAVVALRFYTRVRIVRVLGGEDWTVLIALVFSLGVSICTITSRSRRHPSSCLDDQLTMRPSVESGIWTRLLNHLGGKHSRHLEGKSPSSGLFLMRH